MLLLLSLLSSISLKGLSKLSKSRSKSSLEAELVFEEDEFPPLPI